MNNDPKYDRDKLVELLSERATFEKSAVGLYDALLDSLEQIDDDELVAAREKLEQCRDEEQEHADWLDDLLERLGGHPAHAMSEAVVRESRAIEQVIRTKPDGAGPLPMVYAMLSAELMDAEGWNLLLELADALDDAPAVRELRKRAEHESEHLELIRHLALTLAKRAVEFHETDAETQLSGLGRSSGRRRVVTASRRRAQAGSGR